MKISFRIGRRIYEFADVWSLAVTGDVPGDVYDTTKSGVAQRSEQLPYKRPMKVRSLPSVPDPAAITQPATGAGLPPLPAPVPTPKRGRPRLHADRKAYNAAKQREYRARKKEKTDGKD